MIGTTYGGDGISTFGLPNLQSRAVVGTGQGPGTSNYVLGQIGGTETVTLTVSQIPAHTHSITLAVTNVTSSSANGTYGVGSAISIQVTFGATVNVTGTPLLALNSGGIASYSSGSGSNTLTFTYTVAAGQNSADLDYISMAALTLNGGTITDANGSAVALTLPAPGTAGSLGANKNIVINTAADVVTNVTSSTAYGTYGAGQAVIPITAWASSGTVNVTGTPQLALNSGGTASYPSGSATNTLIFVYTVAAGQNSARLDYTSTSALTLNGGTITDANASNAISDIVLASRCRRIARCQHEHCDRHDASHNNQRHFDNRQRHIWYGSGYHNYGQL